MIWLDWFRIVCAAVLAFALGVLVGDIISDLILDVRNLIRALRGKP